MTENINFELMKELRIAGSKMMHPGKPFPGRGPMEGHHGPMPGPQRGPMGECRPMPGQFPEKKGFRNLPAIMPEGPFGNKDMHGFESRPGMMKEGHDFRKPLPREFILSILLENGNAGMRQKDLADKLGIRSAAMSEAIDKLEDNGYIERKVDETDRRATLIFLTEKGEARANEVHDQREHRFDRIFGDLTEDEKKQLLTLLRKMNSSPVQV
ncbi:MAG: MarR family transcriptional regulator [Oscillospiraceae bacterium]|nr:MarR family transcriptional regulator [Oscillospiraceae bacterium]